MKLIPLPVFFILILLAGLAWWLNGYLQKLIRPRENFGRLLLYIASGFFMLFAGVYMAVRLILWLFPHGLK